MVLAIFIENLKPKHVSLYYHINELSYTININVVAKYILAACFRNRYPCIKIMQYQSLHKFTLNSITEQEIMSWNVFVG